MATREFNADTESVSQAFSVECEKIVMLVIGTLSYHATKVQTFFDIRKCKKKTPLQASS